MSWATNYIRRLKAGETIQFRPRGHSMTGRIDSGQLVTVVPYADTIPLLVGQAVLCKVSGNDYLHLIKALDASRVQIGNNRGYINGWTSRTQIYGIVTKVEP